MLSASLARNSTSRPIETRLSRTFEVRSPLRPIVLQDVAIGDRAVGAAPSGSKMSCETLVDVGADALENIGGAVDHGVEQVHHDRSRR